jgi:hypothetical protein
MAGIWKVANTSNSVTINGVTYIQLHGRNSSHWWPEDAVSFRDGTAYDTDEIADITGTIKEMKRDHESYLKEAAGYLAEATRKKDSQWIATLENNIKVAKKEFEKNVRENQEWLDVLIKLKSAKRK